MRIASRTAALVLSAAVLTPVLPSVVGPAAAAPVSQNVTAVAPKTANTAAGKRALAAWTARDAKAKATLAYLAKREAARTLAAYRAASGSDRGRLRAAADFARRDAAAKSTVAHLAGVRAAKAARAVAPARASRSSRRASLSGTTVWDRLAKCEAGGNWAINTGNGYYGGLQFSASSWRAVGGTGLPHQHSRAEQIKRGGMLQDRAGWGSWPACSRKLGLR